MSVKQILMVLSVEYEIEVTILSSHLLPWVNVFSTLQCSGLIQAKERYKHTTALLIKVARVEITARAGLMWLQPQLQKPLSGPAVCPGCFCGPGIFIISSKPRRPP